MKKLCILVHGFNVRDGGENTVDRLAPLLSEQGYETDRDKADYGYFSLFMVRFKKHRAVARIAEAIREAIESGQTVAIISHSNGANYTHKALHLLKNSGHRLDRVKEVRLSPAVNRSTGSFAKLCTVFHTRSDIWPWLSGFLLWHPWGSQGTFGHRKDADNMENMRSWDHTDMVKGHSDYFNDDNVKLITFEVIKAIET